MIRRARRSSLRQRPIRSLRSGRFEQPIDGAGECLPGLSLVSRPTPAFGGERVDLGPAAVLRGAPGRRDPALVLQPIEGRVERPLVDLEYFARQLMDPFAEGPAVGGAELQGPEDEEVEGALEQV